MVIRLDFKLGTPTPSTMFDRPVISTPVTRSTSPEYKGKTHPPCGDCGADANQMITERNHNTWFWCGVCEVGG